jgi:hypothetical protein
MSGVTIEPHDSNHVSTRGSHITIRLQDLVNTAPLDLFASPIRSGLISSALRSAPILDPSSYLIAKPDGAAKEIAASVTIYRPQALSYSFLWDNPDFSIPFSPNMDSYPEVARDIRRAFCSVRDSLCSAVLYPRIASKSIGRQASTQFLNEVDEDILPDIAEEIELQGVTTRHLQYVSYWKGTRFYGPAEVRISWKYLDLKPRVYFAQGPDTFYASRYVQQIFNTIADSLEIVHRKNRYHPPSQELTRTDTVIIYDYSSFTSTLDEAPRFIDALAEFFAGVKVQLVDHKEGLTDIDLGDLLRSFNQSCNIFPEFDIGGLGDFSDGPHYLIEHSCGMLGVPGDILSKTILHGIHLCFVTGSMHRARCIGDDARY